MSLTLKDNQQALRVPPVLQFAAAALIVAAVSWGAYPQRSVPAYPGPQTVSVLPESVSYRASGEFQLNGMPVDGQLLRLTPQAPVEIMKYQVTQDQYA